MPEVIRGSRSHDDGSVSSPSDRRPSRFERVPSPPERVPEESEPLPSPNAPFTSTDSPAASPSPSRHVAFSTDTPAEKESEPNPNKSPTPHSKDRRRSSTFLRTNSDQDRSDDPSKRPEADAYYDSRAATKREFKRRGTTLQDYYKTNPELLPQLPFTWHHGLKRWRLTVLIVVMWIDACVLPIALYYGMYYGGKVENWITFAVITTIWGGPTYLEFGLRTFKLMKKSRFYRPLGTDYRWCFDLVTWASSLTIFAVTALFIIGGAPHIVWLRVLCMPAPAILYCLGGVIGILTLYHAKEWPAPFRISSTNKGERVKSGVYYFMEDVVAVNANAGRPYREALAARYDSSPRFRQMLYNQSVFWSVPALILAVPLTIIAVIHDVPATIAYGICWAVPFIWATIWAFISIAWIKRDMARERHEWEMDNIPDKGTMSDDHDDHADEQEHQDGHANRREKSPDPTPEQRV